MNCTDAQRLSPLFLTGEMETHESDAFNAHVAVCAACSRSLLDDIALSTRLTAALREEPLNETPVRRYISREIARRSRSRWWPRVGAVAAALLISVIAYRAQRPVPVTRFLAAAARDHRLEVVERQPRRWHAEVPEIDAEAAHFGLSASKVAALAPEGYRLQRAKTCGLQGQLVLHLVYTDDKHELSIYVRQGGGQSRAVATTQVAGEDLATVNTGRYTAVVVAAAHSTDCQRAAQHLATLI